jgi:hypothetical protein
MGLESHDRARHIHSPFRPVVSFESISFYPRGPQRITLLVQRRRRLFITWYVNLYVLFWLGIISTEDTVSRSYNIIRET